MDHAPEYVALFCSATLRPDRRNEVLSIARKIATNRPRYDAVSRTVGLPWFVIGILHAMHGDGDFNQSVLKAEKTRESDWEARAVLELKDAGLTCGRSVPEIARALESFNGLGYRDRGVPSAYLWAWTSVHEAGMFAAGGGYLPTAVPARPGAMAILKGLIEVDPLSLDLPPLGRPKTWVKATNAKPGRSVPWKGLAALFLVLKIGVLLVGGLHLYRQHVEITVLESDRQALRTLRAQNDREIRHLREELELAEKRIADAEKRQSAPRAAVSRPKRTKTPAKTSPPPGQFWPF